jgi:hypothetical protein
MPQFSLHDREKRKRRHKHHKKRRRDRNRDREGDRNRDREGGRSPLQSPAHWTNSSPNRSTYSSASQRSSELRRKYAHETSDNVHRQPLLWTSAIESKFKEWYTKCVNNSALHNDKAKKYKKINYAIAIPAASIPLSAAALANYIETYPIVQYICLVMTGILSIVQTTLNYGKKSERHDVYSSSYGKLGEIIGKELIKPQKNRREADVFLQEIMDEFNGLNRDAPSL